MSYTPPPGDAANATWVGVPAYTPPAGDATNVSWAPSAFAGDGAGALAFTGAGLAAHGVAATGAGALSFTGSGLAEITDPAVTADGAGALQFTGAGIAVHGVTGTGAGALVFTGAGSAVHGIAAAGSGALSFTGTGLAAHLRYEARGSVKTGLILVNRRVRCYSRDTGQLLGQADTISGFYRVPAGFTDDEVYTLAIDLSPGAADWIPPVANRLIPVLASDTA